jgi:hypothetical protein
LEQADDGQLTAVVELFVAAQINAIDLACTLLESRIDDGATRLPAAVARSAERTLLELVQVHLRAALSGLTSQYRVAVTNLTGSIGLRALVTDPAGEVRADITVTVDGEDESGWLRLASAAGDLEVWHDDVFPAPLEIVHLRVQAWLELVLAKGPAEHGDQGLATQAEINGFSRVRGIFVLGVPRSGTTLMGNYVGSHPDVLGLAEYGGFYVAHSVGPAYINRLPGRQHDEFVSALGALPAAQVAVAAQEQGCGWYCDATPWNLEIAGALNQSLPAAELWVRLNSCIDQLPIDRTVVVGYDVFAAQPADTIAGLREALAAAGLNPALFDEAQFAASHATIVGQPRPTVATVRDGELVFGPISSLDAESWTAEVHERVWPIVADMHRALVETFPDVYASPPRPSHVSSEQW